MAMVGTAVSAVVLTVFMFWMTLSWLMGLSPSDDYDQGKKVMKIDVMILVALVVVISRFQIVTLAWVMAFSLGILGVKGGFFTVINGGNYRVWGPPGTFIEDNNEFALALIMTIPLLRFCLMQARARWLRGLVIGVMLLTAASALGSYSRGALLAIAAMTLVMWWRGPNKFRNGVLLLVVAVAMLAFMPDQWGDRMASIETYEEDRSALGRISAWWTAFNVAKNYPFGIGFELARPELFARFSPYPDMIHAAHSIYFLVLGNHGFVGLFLFLLMWALTWRQAAQVRRMARGKPEYQWCHDLAGMCQVSIAGYAVGGAFLSLSYFDLPYYVMVLVLATREWLRRRLAGEPPDAEVVIRANWLRRVARVCGASPS
ncbi:MAG: putative O-glycosylation ligase, exosortase A system-associated [Burkholderiales bacterium PBB5]|nr:MAG: putative O-glycosylation ligase, exosortase A system-associated [Burkholderiales bacterium PBB5]